MEPEPELTHTVHSGKGEAGGGAPLATPIPHSSLGGVGGGAGGPFDPPRAAADLLGRSFAARRAVGGAAATAMNLPPKQRLYRGLVSLAVPLPQAGPRRGGAPPPPKVPGPALSALGEGRGGGAPWLPAPPPPAPPGPSPAPPLPPSSCAANCSSGGRGSPNYPPLITPPPPNYPQITL